jgi:hypothetical protein
MTVTEMNLGTFMHFEGGIYIHYDTGAFQGDEALFLRVKPEVMYGVELELVSFLTSVPDGCEWLTLQTSLFVAG